MRAGRLFVETSFGGTLYPMLLGADLSTRKCGIRYSKIIVFKFLTGKRVDLFQRGKESRRSVASGQSPVASRLSSVASGQSLVVSRLY